MNADKADLDVMLTSSQIQLAAHPVDPFQPCQPGRYADDLVVVVREDEPSGDQAALKGPPHKSALHFFPHIRSRSFARYSGYVVSAPPCTASCGRPT